MTASCAYNAQNILQDWITHNFNTLDTLMLMPRRPLRSLELFCKN